MYSTKLEQVVDLAKKVRAAFEEIGKDRGYDSGLGGALPIYIWHSISSNL